MSIWDTLDYLNTLVDDSDPDIELDQLQHLLQTSEAIRRDGHPDWFCTNWIVTILERYFVYLENLNGLWLGILFR